MPRLMKQETREVEAVIAAVPPAENARVAGRRDGVRAQALVNPRDSFWIHCPPKGCRGASGGPDVRTFPGDDVPS